MCIFDEQPQTDRPCDGSRSRSLKRTLSAPLLHFPVEVYSQDTKKSGTYQEKQEKCEESHLRVVYISHDHTVTTTVTYYGTLQRRQNDVNLLAALYNTQRDWSNNNSSNKIAFYVRTPAGMCSDLPQGKKNLNESMSR